MSEDGGRKMVESEDGGSIRLRQGYGVTGVIGARIED
jgi:hypothetical protein